MFVRLSAVFVKVRNFEVSYSAIFIDVTQTHEFFFNLGKLSISVFYPPKESLLEGDNSFSIVFSPE